MNDKSFDKVIDELYQKRKHQFDVPTINLSSTKNPTQEPFSLSKIVAILSVSLTVSVGVFAIIQHFSILPKSKNDTNERNIGYVVERENKPEINSLAVVIPKKTVQLPKVPASTLPTLIPNVAVINSSLPVPIKSAPLPKTSIPGVTVSSLSINPTFKVLPNIDEKLPPIAKNGFVQLRYNINTLGKTENIEIVKSNLGRKIQRAAKKALVQWRYKPKQKYKTHNDVVFEFKATK